MLSRRSLLLAALLAAALVASPAFAQAPAYPAKPIRLVVPYPPGGPLDTAARALAERVKDTLGTVVVENRAGAGGNLGVDYVAKQPADGYTLVIGAVATHAINPWLFARLPYDPIKDFAPVTLIAEVPNVLVMTPEAATKLGIGTVADLIGYARRNPGKLNYASGGNGSGGHMAGELLKSMARVSIVHIPYAGAAPAQLGLLAGQTDLMFDNLASAAPQIRAGKLKAFAVTTRQHASGLANVPTMAEAGGAPLAGFDISTWFGVLAPAGTPTAVVERLNAAFRGALGSAEMRERLARMGAEPSATTPAEFAAFIRSELAKYEQVVKFSGARVD
ncbi:MAG: tripartite tricarboxylate transporter substrate binding protein [Burkholderiaceae bacterium]|nr:tripartite tricarboxylate transporter substrate binding protein [Burkholderiaceae bacterium]